MIEELSLTTVQKALTVVNECLLSFSPSSLSFSLSCCLFLVSSFQLSFSFPTEEGRTPFLEEYSQSRSGCFDRGCPPQPFLSIVFAHTRFQPGIQKPHENFRNRGRRYRRRTLSSVAAATIKATFHFVYSKWLCVL